VNPSTSSSFALSVPDYPLPSTACLLQHRLGLSRSCGALDYNLGCSGFVYGLGIAQGLIASGQADRILLLTGDTYNQYISDADRGLKVLFGDGAAATLIEPDLEAVGCWPIAFGTDGEGAQNLIVKSGGSRNPASDSSPPRLFMNGPEILTFTMKVIPDLVRGLLDKSNLKIDDIDLFVFHQANEFMLAHLRDFLSISREKFVINMSDCGNTVSSSIPIALVTAHQQGHLKPNQRVMLVGFGVGYSWSASIINWRNDCEYMSNSQGIPSL
jgi:3-oxoacyl-[acyl-carrier-protein] synthase-3